MSKHGKEIAQAFEKRWKGSTLDERIIADVVKKLTADSTAYPAHGEIVSVAVWLKVGVDIDKTDTYNGGSFRGSAWGVGTPGGGALFGDVYTDNLEEMYQATVNWEFNATPVYTSVLFFDGDSHLLGHFEAGAVSTVAGIGGGEGAWTEED